MFAQQSLAFEELVSVAQRRGLMRDDLPHQFTALLGVIPGAQTASFRHVAITMYSLESYAEGFVIHGCRWLEEGHPMLTHVRRRCEEVSRNLSEAAQDDPDPGKVAERIAVSHRLLTSQPTASMSPVAVDDKGRQYASSYVCGSGLGQDVQFTYAFVPALDPAARELHLEVPVLQWLVKGTPEERWRDGGTDTGPWTYAVHLQDMLRTVVH